MTEERALPTLSELVASRASSRGNAPYLEDARSERMLTYRTLGDAVIAWQTLLDSLQVPLGGAVLVDITDPLSFAAAHLAVIAAGRRSVPVDPGAAASELDRLGDVLATVQLLVTDRESISAWRDATVARVDQSTFGPVVVIGGTSHPGRGTDEGERAAGGAGGALLFTSGSTGEPKGVDLPESQLLLVAQLIAEHNSLTEEDRGYSPLPLFHVNAEVVGLLSTLTAGSTLVLDKRFRRTGFWELMSERRVTWINAVPAILAVLASSGEIRAPEGLRFIRSASAPLPEPVGVAFKGIPLIVSWGMTEGASQVSATPLGETRRAGSVGRPVGSEVQARSDDGAVLPPGEVGTLWVRGPGIVSSYFRGRAAERFDEEGWLSSGDLGSIDSDGWIFLVGRSDDVINRGGEKVYPAEVEDVLLGDPAVREAVVIARADAILGSVPVAYVIPAEELLDDAARDALIAALIDRCAAELPRFKRPVEVAVVDDVPRAPTEKVQRRGVRELDAARVSSE